MSERVRVVFSIGWLLLAATTALAMSAGFGPGVQLPDIAHLFGHFLLFSVLGLTFGQLLRSAHAALVLTLLAGATIEVAQMLGLWLEGMPFPRVVFFLLPEASFDMTVNAVAGMFGLALAGRHDTADALGSWLHPIVVGPLAVYGLGWAARGEVGSTLLWTLTMLACFSPAVLAWVVGVRDGHFKDVDLRDRRQRPTLFGVATACAAVFAGLTLALAHAPFSTLGMVLFLSSLGVTLLTTAGLKISGHVSAPLILAGVLLPYSERGIGVLLAAALLVSWARIRARCHQPHEVAAAWVFAGVLAVLGWWWRLGQIGV